MTSPSSELSASTENQTPILPAVISIAVIVIATIAVLWPLTRCDFVNWDDPVTVSDNPRLKPPGPGGVIYYWTHAAMGLYVPVTYTVWSAIAFLSPPPLLPGQPMKLDPSLFHGANLLIHVMSAIIVCRVLRQIVSGRGRDFAACAGALLFAIHPIQVEPVAWVSGTKDLLAGFFSLVAIWQYIAWSDRSRDSTERLLRYLIVLAAAGLAMLSKPSAMVLPVILAIVDSLVLRRPLRDIARGVIPVVLVCLPCAIAASLIQHPSRDLAFWQRPIVVLDSISFYVRKLFWPANLAADYGRRPSAIFNSPTIWLCWLIPAVAGVVLWSIRKSAPTIVAGALIFIAGALPVLGLVSTLFSEKSTVADHYLYLSMLGIAMIVAAILARFHQPIAIAVASVLLVASGVVSFRQTRHWKDTSAFFSHIVEVSPHAWAGRIGMSGVFMQQKKFPEAETMIREAITLYPSSVNHRTLGQLLLRASRPADAVQPLLKALELERGIPVARTDLAEAYLNSGNPGEAIRELKRVLAEYPDDPRAKNLMRMAQGM